MPLNAMTSAATITSQKATNPNSVVVSPCMPACLKKLSVPARSVKTLKLMARSARSTAKRTTLANSHPTATTSSASNSFGKKAANWCRNSRVASTNKSMLCIRAPHYQLPPIQDSLQRDADPGRPVADFVAQFVQRLLQFEQPQQTLRGLQRLVRRRGARGRIVGRQEGGSRLSLPTSGEGRQSRRLRFIVRDAAQS